MFGHGLQRHLATPQSAATLFNLIDATSPFELVVGAPGTVGSSPTTPGRGTAPVTGGGSGTQGGGGGTGGKGARCAAPTGRLAGRRLGPLALGMTRARARKLRPHFSVRRKLYMDFYCQTSADGIRAFYPSPTLLRTLLRSHSRSYRNRIVVALTAGRRYALRGVHPGAKLHKVSGHLKVGRAYHVGKNFWYVIANGPSVGVLKVRHGVIQEVGIASKVLARTLSDRKRFLRLLI